MRAARSHTYSRIERRGPFDTTEPLTAFRPDQGIDFFAEVLGPRRSSAGRSSCSACTWPGVSSLPLRGTRATPGTHGPRSGGRLRAGVRLMVHDAGHFGPFCPFCAHHAPRWPRKAARSAIGVGETSGRSRGCFDARTDEKKVRKHAEGLGRGAATLADSEVRRRLDGALTVTTTRASRSCRSSASEKRPRYTCTYASGRRGTTGRQGTNRHRRQEAKTCRNPERDVAILVEKLRKEQPSD